MKQNKLIMGMPITIEIADQIISDDNIFDQVFTYFDYVEKKFSLYKDNSEISAINRGKIEEKDFSDDMKEVFRLSKETKILTKGFFDIEFSSGQFDPSGLVKGWAIYKVSQIIKNKGYKNFYVDAGGDMEISGKNQDGQNWRVGIRSPFEKDKIVKTLALSDLGMATSGTYIRGQHIYNPHQKDQPILDIVSLTVIGSNVYEADRFATTVFAMGRQGIDFLEKLSDLEGYMIDRDGVATMTSGFAHYVVV